MKRWLAILGPQQVVLISNTRTRNTEIFLKIMKGEEGARKKKRNPGLSNEMRVLKL